MTKSVIAIVAAAALGGGIAVAAPKLPTANPAVPLAKENEKPREIDETHETRRVMAQAADKALNSTDDLLSMITKKDRDRVSTTLSKGDEKKYKDIGNKLQAEWKKKFGKDFSAEGHVDELGGLKTKLVGEGENQMAVITFPGSEAGGKYELHLTREPNNWWRINLPDKVDGATFEKNMMSAIDQAAAQVSKLPDGEAGAYQSTMTVLLHEMAFAEGSK